MKLYSNKKYNTIAVYAIIVIAVNVLLITAIFKLNAILGLLDKIVTVMMPIIWGLGLAFLINPLMVTTERMALKVIKKPKRPKLLRAFSVTVASIIFLGLVAGIIAVIVPEFVKSFNDIVNNFSSLVEKAENWINKLFNNYPKVQKLVSDKLVDFGTDLNKLQPMLENILSGAWGFLNVIYNFVLGFIFSIYLLVGKEEHLAQTKKIIFANFRHSTAEKILHFGSDANLVFSGFISGKIIDSFIIGVICFIGLTIIGMPYNVLISVIIGVTNVIPFFGPLIGAIPSGMLMLLVEPKMVIWLLIFIFMLQQFDGNILGPKILGGSTGLPAIWVMIALFVCGGLFGFIGMLLGVPTFALIYKITRESIDNKLKRKKLPTSTQYYIENAGKLTGQRTRKAPLTPEELENIIIPSCDEVNEATDDPIFESNESSDDSVEEVIGEAVTPVPSPEAEG